MRGHPQRTCFNWPTAPLHIPNFLADARERIAEPVYLLLRFRFGWFDHKSSWDRKTHCWRMKPVVDQPLRNIINGHARHITNAPEIDDTLMCDPPPFAAIQNRIVLL